MKNLYHISIGATFLNDCHIWSFAAIAENEDEMLKLALDHAMSLYPNHSYQFPPKEYITPMSFSDLERIVKEVYEPMKQHLGETNE